jgi:hypothetical protein
VRSFVLSFAQSSMDVQYVGVVSDERAWHGVCKALITDFIVFASRLLPDPLTAFSHWSGQ